MSEAELRRRFVDRLKALGCIVIPIEPSASNGMDEYPDVIVIGTGGRCAFVEFKRPDVEKARPGQEKVLAMLRARGYHARVHNNETAAATVARAAGAIKC